MIQSIGAICFGLVTGYITYRTLVRTTKSSQISDLTAVLSAVGGAAVTGLFPAETNAFGWYAIGLAAGMVVYFTLYLVLNGKRKAAVVLGQDSTPAQQAGGDTHAPI